MHTRRTSNVLPTHRGNLAHKKYMSSRDFKTSRDSKFKWKNKKGVRLGSKLLLALLALGALVFFWMYELHIELAKYRRGWIKTEIKETEPLRGCFDNLSKEYDERQLISPKYNQLQSGLSYKHGFDCYGHSRLVQMQPGQGKVRSTIHLYWRSDIAALGYREKVLLDSIFATQDLDFVDVKLWSNGDLRRFNGEFLDQYLHDFPHHFSVGTVDLHSLAKGTPLDDSNRLNLNDQRAWLDGDVVRILLLWNYGGVWVDMDSILTRDLQPLLEHEFVTQWDCYGGCNVLIS